MLHGSLLKDAAWAFFIRGLGAAAAFIMSLAVARSISPDQAGYFFLSITLIQILSPMGLLGTNVASLRFIGSWAAEGDWSSVWAVARTTWLWAGMCLFGISLIVYFFAGWISSDIFNKPGFRDVLLVMSPGIILTGAWMLLSFQLQAIKKVTESISVLSIFVPCGVAIGALVLPVSSAVEVALIYVVVGVLTVTCGVFWWCRYVPRRKKVSIDKAVLMNSCFPLWIIAVVGTATHWGGQLVAGIWLGAEQVAYLAVAQRTANLVSFILIAVNFIVAPQFAALYKQGKMEEMKRLSLRSVRLMYLFGVPLLAILCFFPREIMGLFGKDFQEAGLLLVILSVGQFVNVISGSVSFLLTMSGNEKDMRNVVLLSGPLSVAAAMVLTPMYGVAGAAAATAMSVSLQNIGAVWLVRKRLGFNTLVFWGKA